MAKQKKSQREVLIDIFNTGKTFKVSQLLKKIAQKTGTEPTQGSLMVLLSRLRGQGFDFAVVKAKRGSTKETTYTLN